MKSSIQLDREIIKVMIADDQLTIRRNLQLQLATAEDIEVIALVDDGIKALEQIAQLAPDVVIIDLEMPHMDGVTAIEKICDRFPQTKTLVFSSHEERDYINRAIIAGAKGYLLKGTPIEDLIAAIRNIYRGYFQLGSGLLEKISRSKSPTFLNAQPQSSLNTDISTLEFEISQSIDKKVRSRFEGLNSLVEHRFQLIAVEQSKIYAQLKKNQLNFYLLLCLQAILTLIVLLNI